MTDTPASPAVTARILAMVRDARTEDAAQRAAGRLLRDMGVDPAAPDGSCRPPGADHARTPR